MKISFKENKLHHAIIFKNDGVLHMYSHTLKENAIKISTALQNKIEIE